MITTQKILKPVLTGLFLFICWQAMDAGAAYSAWDPTGTTASSTPNGNWEYVSWGPQGSTALSATLSAWPETGVLPVFAAGTSATGAYTVTANSDHTIAGIFVGGITGSSIGTVTINGTGILTISPGQQGFNVGSGGSLTILNTLTGTGQMINESAGSIFLLGTNTYTGGTQLGFSSGSPFSGTINVNNNSSFGTGPIAMTTFAASSTITVQSGVLSAITLPNSFTTAAANLNIIGNPAGLTFAGPWTMATTPNIGSGGAGNLVIISGIMSGAGGLNKYNPGILKLMATNTYNGVTTISNGTLALGPNASLNNSTGLLIAPNAAGTVFDVSANPAFTIGFNSTIYAQGTGTSTATAANIRGASGGTVSLLTRPLKLTFTPTVFTGDTAHPPLFISQGALILNNNTITVTNAAATALGTGTYRLIQVGNGTSGTITGTPNPTVTVVGTGIAAGRVAALVVSNGNVNLVVKPPAVITNLSMSQATTLGVGVVSVTVSGKVSAGAVFPAQNETVTVTINGGAHTTSINDATGDFSYTFNPASVPYLNTNTIVYTYPGDASLGAATNSTKVVGHAFYSGDALAGFNSGTENLSVTNTSGLNMFTWSTTNPGLPVTDWTLESAMVETTLNDVPGQSRYSLVVSPPTSSLVYYVCAPALNWPFLSPTALQWIVTDDSDNFTFYPTNTTITAAGVLGFLTPPVFIQQPLSQTNLVGKNAGFTATVTGTSPLHYQWYFNTTPIGGASTNAPITITNISAGNAGSYSVVVTNLYGSATSLLAGLTVLLPPQVTTQMNSNGFVLSAQTLSGTTVELQTTTNLVAPAQWANIATNVVDTNGFVQFTNTVVLTNKVRFYRLYFP